MAEMSWTVFLLTLLVTFVDWTEGLYVESDKVVVLNTTTFVPTVVGTSNAWIVQFYNSWCGHCRSYKPTWKEFANDVEAWKTVVSVAVVDCSIAANEKLCRDYEVHAFPTIKFFGPHTSKNDLGTLFVGHRDATNLRQLVINTLTTLAWNDSFPLVSNFIPTKKENVLSLWLDDLSPYKAVVLIVENNSSYTGREVMLDLANYPSLKVVRMLPEKELALSDVNITSVPAVLLLEHNGSYHSMQTNFDRNSIVEFVKEHLQSQQTPVHEQLGNGDEGLGAGNNPNESDLNPATEYVPVPDGVYLVDLENAVRYVFMQEIPLRKRLDAEETEVFRDFVSLLVKHFPGQRPMISFLQRVLEWLNERLKGFPMVDYLAFMDEMQIAVPNITVMQPWMGCHGSQADFRGYPCSLWLLFHTLTVGAYNDRNKGSTNYDPLEALIVMRDYIKNFFGCQDCSQHFQAMSATLSKDIVEPADGVLWLWQAHNKVNARLHGALSEDPKHPKVQFPPSDLCPFCQVNSEEGSQWDLPEILSFLTKRYSRHAILGQNDSMLPNAGKAKGVGPSPIMKPDIRPASDDAKPMGPVSKNFQTVNLQLSVVKTNDPVDSRKLFFSSWGFSTVDMSLCVMLYGCSALILLTVYFVVVVKRRLRKKSTGYKIFGLV